MVGDGANDLIAIKDSDVGIGISCSDAVYSASFAVQDLGQIIEIIKESKSTERQIVDIVQYFSILQFLSIINTLVLTGDVSFTTSNMEIYKNFSSSLAVCVALSLSLCAERMVKYAPNSNFMAL
jgi:P-type E1-E2 ATPase